MSLVGDAADWDKLRAVHIIEGPGGIAAEFKASYDEEAFYAWVRVRDDSPLANGATVIEELLKGGDAIGFCFGGLEGKGPIQRIFVARVQGKPVVLALRPNWPEKKPYTFTSISTAKMDFVGLLPEAEVQFQTDKDGYLARVKLPWKSLGIKPPKTDDLFPFDVQVIFSDAAGTTNASTCWWHSEGQGPLATLDLATEARLYPKAWGQAKLLASDPGPQARRPLADDDDQAAAFRPPVAGDERVPIRFELEQPAKVSLIIHNEQGFVYRELLRAYQLPRGAHTVYWNGRDRTGQPLPAGEYAYRIGIFDGIKTKFLGSVGNSGRPVWRSRDGLGSIGGAHGGPAAVASGADGIYMLHGGEEGQKCLRKIDPATGKAQWFASIGVFASAYGITESGDSAYMLHGRGKGMSLTRLDAKTGKTLPIGKLQQVSLGMNLKLGGLAVLDGKAYFTEPSANRIGCVDLTSGEILADIPMPAPQGLCQFDRESLAVCTGSEVIRLEPATGKKIAVFSKLDAPRAVALDMAGNIYVAEQGAAQQIRKFSPSGKQLAAFGKRGGREQSAVPYDPLAFHNLLGIAVARDGVIWAVESGSPRRFLKLSPEGKWLEDFYGPTGYATVVIDLDDVSNVLYQADQYGPRYVQAKVDFAAYGKLPGSEAGSPVGTWKVEALHYLSQNGKDDSAQPDFMTPVAKAGYGRAIIFKGTNAHRYLFKPKHDSFALWVERDGRWRAAAAAGKQPAKVADGKASNKAATKEEYYLWSDANGDSLVQPEEVSEERPALGSYTWLDRDLTLRGSDGDLKPASVDARGVPSYAGGKVAAFYAADAPPLRHYLDQENYGFSHSPPGPGGVRYASSNIGVEQGRNFWDRASELRLCRFVDGKLQWIVGQHNGRFRHNGDSVMVMNLGGELDGVVMATEVNSNFIAYTTDGLTLGWVSTDASGRAIDEGPIGWYVENVQPGHWVKDPKTGKRVLIGCTTEDVRFLEIDGIFGGQIRRINGKVKLASAQPRSAQIAGKDGSIQTEIPYQTYTVNQGGRYLGADGYDTEWKPSAPSIVLRDGQSFVGELRLRRDAGLLCVFAEVLSTQPLPEADAKLKSSEVLGNVAGVELLLGPAGDPQKVGEVARAGDTRIFLSAQRVNGKLVGAAFACRPASSPLAVSAWFKRQDNKGKLIGELPKQFDGDAKSLWPIPGAVVGVRERFDGQGWALEAHIPLALLPELTTMESVTFARADKTKATETRPDLTAPLRLNVAIHCFNERSAGGEKSALVRIPWRDDGQTLLDLKAKPTAMNPARWGTAKTSP